MTIALGILASDGFVIAADREEGDGYLKNDAGKVAWSFRAMDPVGSIVVTGAGSGPYLDEVSELIRDAFTDNAEGTEESVAASLREKHRAYYTETIVPLAALPDNDRADYALLIACRGESMSKKMWTTSKLAFSPVSLYDAVGVGSSVANFWLERLWENVSVMYAAKLAAYVVYQVKSSVGSCGMGTDIVVSSYNAMPLPFSISADAIREWESAFRRYRKSERNAFYYFAGLREEKARLQRTTVNKDAIDGELDAAREQLAKLNDGWPEVKPRSASQKSEGRQ